MSLGKSERCWARIDSFNLFSTSTHDFKFGEVTSTTDENNQVVTNTYDNFGRLVSVIGPYQQGTLNTTIFFAYSIDPANTLPAPVPWAVTSHIDTLGPNGRIETALFTDGLKRVVQTKKDAAVSPQAGTPPTNVMTVSGRVNFDPFGRTIKQFYPVTEPAATPGTFGQPNTFTQQSTFNATFDTVQPTVTAYDVLDRVTQVTLPDSTPTTPDITTTAYDFGPDRSGLTQFRTTVTDANGKQKQMFRDVRSLITTVNEFISINGVPTVFQTSYAYDPLRQITSVTDNQNNVTSVVYDLFGRRTQINSPDAGLTTFTYDLADNLTAKQTANLAALGSAFAVVYRYDFNRLFTISYPTFPANDVIYIYGSVGAGGNGAGRIMHIQDAAGTEDRLYGPLGEIVQETRNVPVGNQVNTYVTQFTFDTWNRLAQMVYPDTPNGEVLTYSYDSGGLVNGVNGNDVFDLPANTAYVQSVNYDKFGHRLLLLLGEGTKKTYAYDPATQRLTNVQATLSIGYTFHNMLFSYDLVGNVTEINNQVVDPHSFTGGNLGNAIGGPWDKKYQYDDLYRLISSQGSFGTTMSYTFSQGYDSIHNITSKTQQAFASSSLQTQISYNYPYTYAGAKPHAPTAIGPFTITHDADGNQITTLTTGTKSESQYLYDEENRLSCFNSGQQTPTPSCSGSGMTDFIYDHAGVRKIKLSSSRTIYPNQYYTDFGGGNSGGQYKHVFIGSERILTKKARIAPDKAFWFYHGDQVDSTSMVTNQVGQLLDHILYFPFGEMWVEERPKSVPEEFFFTAKEFDPETGLYNFGARYLNPRFSKWMSTDPTLGDYMPAPGTAVAYQSPGLTNKWRSYPDLPGLGGVYTSLNFGVYSYGHQNPATYKDPDGRLTIIVHGTFVNRADWAQPGADFNKAVSATFGEAAVPLDWIGDNTVAARNVGTADLSNMIARHTFAPGEKLNIIAHSHGGNVVKAYTNLADTRKIDTLINLGTPQRDDYQINPAKVDQYINVFSENDWVQNRGGYTDIYNPITRNTTRVEAGSAGRRDPAARNVEASTVTVPGRIYGTREMDVGHLDLHTVPVWNQRVVPQVREVQ